MPPTECNAVRELQVNAQINYLGNALERLANNLSSLDRRLEPVLRNQPTAPPSDEKDRPEESLVPLASTLRDYTKLVANSGDIVDRMLSTLEL